MKSEWVNRVETEATAGKGEIRSMATERMAGGAGRAAMETVRVRVAPGVNAECRKATA